MIGGTLMSHAQAARLDNDEAQGQLQEQAQRRRQRWQQLTEDEQLQDDP